MIPVNSKEELDKLRSENPMAVTMIRSDGCTHCRQLHPLVEKRCKDVEGVIPVIDCPVDKQFCIDELKGLKKESIPLLIGTERSNPNKPVFIIEGADKDQVNNNFDIMKKLVADAKKKGSMPKNPQKPVEHSGEGLVSPQPAGPKRSRDTSTDDMVNAALGFNPARRNHEPVAMCTPGFDCSSMDYEEKAIDFLLSRKENRIYRG